MYMVMLLHQWCRWKCSQMQVMLWYQVVGGQTREEGK